MSPESGKLVWRGRDAVLLAVICAAMAAVSMLLSRPEGSVFRSIVDIGAWLRGTGAKPAVVTWPAWGYAWIVAWMPRFEWIIALQACLGVLSLGALAARLRTSMPRQSVFIAVLCVSAIPWHDMQLTLYPSGMAGSLLLLALLSLDSGLIRSNLKLGVLAGVLMGLAQNMRTEFVLLPVIIGIGTHALKRWRIIEIPSVKPLWGFIMTAFVLQLPWAFFYHAQTGRYSLTESNFGHVIYVSLGSDPDNPWKIVGNDAGAMQALRDAGYAFSSLSEPGNQVLRRLVLARVALHPYGLVQRTVQQLRNTIVAPFNWGEPRLDNAGSRDLDVLRQELKARLGVGVNVAKLIAYRNQDLYPNAKQNGAAVLALFYQIAAVGFGSLILLAGISGMALALLRGRSRPDALLLWFLACAALYKILQDVLLFYQVNYLNNVYPMFLPFAAITLTAIADRCKRGSFEPPSEPGRAA
jgi:hypothetical protein